MGSPYVSLIDEKYRVSLMTEGGCSTKRGFQVLNRTGKPKSQVEALSTS